MRLYRGTGWCERLYRRYSFSWTRDKEIALKFANRPVRPEVEDGVILSTLAPPDAILLAREAEGYYDEGEVVVDPFRLGPITVVERLSHRARKEEEGGGLFLA